jgi:hypothetical protein
VAAHEQSKAAAAKRVAALRDHEALLSRSSRLPAEDVQP